MDLIKRSLKRQVLNSNKLTFNARKLKYGISKKIFVKQILETIHVINKKLFSQSSASATDFNTRDEIEFIVRARSASSDSPMSSTCSKFLKAVREQRDNIGVVIGA